MMLHCKILWVENHAAFARIAVKQFLHQHTVTVVPSIATARQTLSNGDFDVILVDYDLDDGKGTELLMEICARSPNAKVIATSSHDRGNSLLLAAGAQSVCSKMAFSKISQVIHEVLGSSADA